ncbi:GntR family transcriptional regulator [Marinactinospora thermotolerans]|uniref:DNA-binding transcriptional regulator, GntR family n=1 Tax=Marinactinospora thermotolerans DSM 45154 TaxID=1122192 RepID=A0A1T4RAR3_9ACTN|nr:GntR family transcriptional regulator [Marinactinospora thermotolerans]SKA13073.1 DNA-binding transcriptional regulator, GntR family [Marinactinospora thermotolerans DSM 45154]
MSRQPRYLWVAETLRRPILSGELAAGTRLPSRAQLARQYEVSEQVSRNALRLLVTEGLVESRPGSGYYVRGLPEAHRFSRTDRASGTGVEPLDAEPVGTVTLPADLSLAQRLRIREDEPLYRTCFVGSSEGAPVAVHTSWEPTILTHGTSRAPGEMIPRLGVIDRLGAAGVPIDRVVEEVSVRPLRETEAGLLRLTPGLPVLVVERTHFSGRRPVETSDLVATPDRCRLVYRLSLARSHADVRRNRYR